MATTLVVCPICTEFGTTPETLKVSKTGHKYRCSNCTAEYWLKVTKGPVCNDDFLPDDEDSAIEYCIQHQLKRNRLDINALEKMARQKRNMVNTFTSDDNSSTDDEGSAVEYCIQHQLKRNCLDINAFVKEAEGKNHGHT
ncbi:MAG: hypothetical protein LBG93_09900 [Treponema sp.]|nr:hypothetical protein [Treponema sp.]